VSWVTKTRQRIRWLWDRARNERASPKQIGWAVGLGAFVGCTPPIGLHGWMAVGLATVLRLNRLFCFIGSRVGNWLMMPFIAIASIQTSHFIRTGTFMALSKDNVLDQGKTVILDWLLGTIPVGGLIGLLAGILAYYLAKRRKPAAPLEPSSESPPSGSPAPRQEG
jgi:uncharacterized protein (DUF2062 family)